MDLTLWNVVLSIVMTVMGFFLKEKISELNRLGILLNKTREEMARDHITRAEVRADMEKIIDRFDKLENKLDRVLEGSSNASR
jgi:archaellum component FlaC